MKIAYLSIGNHIHTERWLCFFRDKGYEVHLITSQPCKMDGIPVHQIGFSSLPKPIKYAFGLIRIKKILSKLNPDILHTHFLTGYGYWGAFSNFHPFILTVWGDDVYLTPRESALKGFLARYALGKADFVTGDSADIVEEAIRMGAKRDNATVIQWGVDLSRFDPTVATDTRRELGIKEDEPVILSTRSFTKDYYNIDVIVDSIPDILKSFPNAKYIFTGYEGDDSRFVDKARKLGISSSTIFLGRVAHEKLPGLVRASDVFVTVPSVDATAVSLLEAMACGAAIVVSSLKSSLEWIENGKNGMVVEPGSREELVGALLYLLKNPDKRKEFGKVSREIVSSRADHRKNMEKMDQIYKRFAAGR
ncbi:MAG: glycosyltransferase family 4 protein [Candidatus Eisenbacteria bacterium]|nr:glycosyltransferase family 4 protein [Candidatus Eisenbacteria bacterium]